MADEARDIETAPVGHRHVEQHEVDRVAALEDRRSGRHARRSTRDDLEALDALDVLRVEFSREAFVVDDRARRSADAFAGSVTRGVVGASSGSTLPPAASTIERTSASPTPRLGARRLRAESVLEDTLAQLGGHARAAVAERQHDVAGGRLRHAHLHPARHGPRRGRIDSVVDQVPHERDGVDGTQRRPADAG